MFDDLHPATICIIIVNILMSIKAWKEYDFFNKFKFQVGPIRYKKENIRFISSGFLHADQAHLIFNMLSLYFFANIVIGNGAYIGIGMNTIKFVFIYLASLIGGNILSYFFHKDNLNYSAVGASGAVSGVIYSAIALYPYGEMGLIFIPFLSIPSWLFGVLYLAYTVYGMKNNVGNIGHSAHMGGALTGLLITLVFKPNILIDHFNIIAFMSVPIAYFIYKELKNKG